MPGIGSFSDVIHVLVVFEIISEGVASYLVLGDTVATCVEGGEATVEVILDTVTVIAAFTPTAFIQFALVFDN